MTEDVPDVSHTQWVSQERMSLKCCTQSLYHRDIADVSFTASVLNGRISLRGCHSVSVKEEDIVEWDASVSLSVKQEDIVEVVSLTVSLSKRRMSLR